MIKNAKQMVYRYDGDPVSDEVEVDFDDETMVPERDQIINT